MYATEFRFELLIQTLLQAGKIVSLHNLFRAKIAQGRESRGRWGVFAGFEYHYEWVVNIRF